MNNLIKRNSIYVLVIIGIFLTINNSVVAQDWDLEIKLDKENFMLHESIWLDITLTNISSGAIRTDGLTTPNHKGLTVEIKNSSGDIVEYTGPVWSFMSSPGLYLFQSGEQQYKCFELLELYGDVKSSSGYLVQYPDFPFMHKGSYTVQAHFEEYSSNVLTFNIIEPSADEKEALELMEEAWSLWRQRDNDPCGRKYQEVIDKFPNSVYAETCLRQAHVYTDNRIKKYFREGIDYDRIGMYKQLLQKFPNSGNSRTWLIGITEKMDQLEREKVIAETIKKNPNTRAAKFAKQMIKRLSIKLKK